MALNFELVVSDQLFSVVLVAYKWFKIQRQYDIRKKEISTLKVLLYKIDFLRTDTMREADF